VRDRILAGLPEARAIAERTIAFYKTVLDRFTERSRTSAPTHHVRGLVNPPAAWSGTTAN